MQRDTKKNYQLYGRNDMIMLDEHNKIYGSLGLAEPYIVATKEGETLLLNGAKDNEPFIGLSIYGKSHQNTVAGNQLFDVSKGGAGWIDTETGEFVTSNDNYVSEFIKVSPAAQYHINYPHPLSYMYTYNSEKVFLRKESYDFTFITGEDVEYIRFAISDSADGALETANAIMFNAGSEELPWEPYTGGQPSPNPDYPQEIVSVGDDGEIGVNVYGGNLLTNATDKVISGDVGNDVNGIWYIVLNRNLLDKKIIFSFDSDSNIGKEFVCQTNAVVNNKNNWSAETVKQIVKGRNYFPLTKLFDEIPEGNITNFYVQLRIYSEPTEAIQFTVSNPMLNIGSTALPFEPYKQPQTLIVSTPDGLPGIPVSLGGNYTDENGQQWISDEIDFKRGKYVKRVAWATFDGKENWYQDGDTSDEGLSYYYYKIPGTITRDIKNGMCSHASWSLKERGMTWREGYYTNSGDSSFEVQTNMTLDEWKSYLSGMSESGNPVKVVLALDIPTETDLTPEQITAYQSLHTNYPTTTVMNDEGAGMKAIYKQIENGG